MYRQTTYYTISWIHESTYEHTLQCITVGTYRYADEINADGIMGCMYAVQFNVLELHKHSVK